MRPSIGKRWHKTNAARAIANNDNDDQTLLATPLRNIALNDLCFSTPLLWLRLALVLRWGRNNLLIRECAQSRGGALGTPLLAAQQ